jgi:hypothetical protein
VFSQYQLPDHHQPEIEWGFIGVNFSLVSKGEDISVAKRFVNNAQKRNSLSGVKTRRIMAGSRATNQRI